MDLEVVVQDVRAAKTFYEVLGVPSEAESEQIRARYRQRCLVLHPDRIGGGGSGSVDPGTDSDVLTPAKEAFQLVSTAYEWLSVPEKREQYDVFLAAGLAKGYFTQPGSEDQRAAAMMAFASMMGSGGPKVCAAPGCMQTLSEDEGKPSSSNYCIKCQQAAQERRICSTVGCGRVVFGDVTQVQCEVCRATPLGKKNRCKNFGCLNELDEQEAQSSGEICSFCRNKPKKCKQFGCMNMTRNTAGYCDKHLDTKSRSVFQ